MQAEVEAAMKVTVKVVVEAAMRVVIAMQAVVTAIVGTLIVLVAIFYTNQASLPGNYFHGLDQSGKPTRPHRLPDSLLGCLDCLIAHLTAY